MPHTVENLKLNIKAAEDGRPWLLLPEEYQSGSLAREYPLPADIRQLQQVATLPLQKNKMDSGSIYIRRAMRELQRRLTAKMGTHRRLEGAENAAKEALKSFENRVKQLEARGEKAIQGVQDRADEAIASLNDLFELGRKGLEGQMQAHLDGKPWQDEEINARAFRECFRMVSQAVKGLGLPSSEREKAREAIVKELSESLKATKEATDMQKSADENKESVH